MCLIYYIYIVFCFPFKLVITFRGFLFFRGIFLLFGMVFFFGGWFFFMVWVFCFLCVSVFCGLVVFCGCCFFDALFCVFICFLWFGFFGRFGGLIFGDFLNFGGFASLYRCLFACFGVFCCVVDYTTGVAVFCLFLFFQRLLIIYGFLSAVFCNGFFDFMAFLSLYLVQCYFYIL